MLQLQKVTHPDQLRSYGYPVSHSLAQFYGVTLLGPMRYRIRTGAIHFAVHVVQRLQGSLSDRDATVRGAIPAGHGPSSALDGSACGVQMEGRPLEDMRRGIGHHLRYQVRRGGSGHVCIAVVIGNWRRVELLRRRPLLQPPQPPATTVSAPATAAESGGGALECEVHEAVVHITEDYNGETVQLFVYHMDVLDSRQAAPFPVSAGTIPSGAPKPATPRALSHGRSVVAARSPPSEGPSTPKPIAPSPSSVVQAASPPGRWCLAEYLVEGNSATLYDEVPIDSFRSSPSLQLALEQDQVEALNRGSQNVFDRANSPFLSAIGAALQKKNALGSLPPPEDSEPQDKE
jgi:hypothetical protein